MLKSCSPSDICLRADSIWSLASVRAALFSLRVPAPSLMEAAPLVSWLIAPVSWLIPLVTVSSWLISIMLSML